MNFSDLLSPIESLTNSELIQRIREIRRRVQQEKPATAGRTQKKVKQEGRKVQTKIDKLLSALSPEELSSLLSQLSEGLDESSKD